MSRNPKVLGIFCLNMESAPDAFGRLVRNEFGAPMALVARNRAGDEVGRLTFMKHGGPIDVFVHEGARRRGVGMALYDALEAVGGAIPAVEEGRALSCAAQALREARALRNDMQSFLPAEIEINGVVHPTTNSKGQPIHPTPEGVRKFWDWFKNSAVVDADGRPLVVYHGTRTGGFTEFKPNVRKGEQLGFGVHFAEDEKFAGLYANDKNVARKGKAPEVYATYLKSNNPLLADAVVVEGATEFALAKKLAGSKLFTMKDDSGKQTAYMQNAIDATSPQRAEKIIREAGYDAVRYGARVGTVGIGARVTAKSQSWIVFRPTQIKSALGNRGTFDPENADIRYSHAPKERAR